MSAEAAAREAAAKDKARQYLALRGTRATVGQLRERIDAGLAALEAFLDSVPAALVTRRAWPDEWSLAEIADHLLETHRPTLDELRCLLAGVRPPRGPIPAGLQSVAPLTRPWPWLLRDLGRCHGDIREALAAVPADFATEARAPLVMVANVEGGPPLEWIEELDWKAYVIVIRLHALDHLNQAKKVAAALGVDVSRAAAAGAP
ncbi:MAG: DinB family protein [Candidatus Rokubacteria bacterium]|nr:DinB family protein [Candidatus Rokubacteria bacterium]